MVEIKPGETIYVSFKPDSNIPIVNTASDKQRPGTNNPIIDYILNNADLPTSASRIDIWRAKKYANQIVRNPQNHGEGKEGREKFERAIKILGLF